MGDSTSLTYKICGRLIRPYALALTASLLSLWLVSVAHVEALPQMHSGHGHALGWFAFAVAGVLIAGWVAHDDRIMRLGLLLSTSVWGVVAFVSSVVVGPLSIFALISGCWVLASGGAWLLERAHAQLPGVGR